MGKIAADANPLAKTIEPRAIGASFQVIEAEMAMDEIAIACEACDGVGRLNVSRRNLRPGKAASMMEFLHVRGEYLWRNAFS